MPRACDVFSPTARSMAGRGEPSLLEGGSRSCLRVGSHGNTLLCPHMALLRLAYHESHRWGGGGGRKRRNHDIEDGVIQNTHLGGGGAYTIVDNNDAPSTFFFVNFCFITFSRRGATGGMKKKMY